MDPDDLITCKPDAIEFCPLWRRQKFMNGGPQFPINKQLSNVPLHSLLFLGPLVLLSPSRHPKPPGTDVFEDERRSGECHRLPRHPSIKWVYLNIFVEGERKDYPQYTQQGSNPITTIFSLVYCESSALDHEAIKEGLCRYSDFEVRAELVIKGSSAHMINDVSLLIDVVEKKSKISVARKDDSMEAFGVRSVAHNSRTIQEGKKLTPAVGEGRDVGRSDAGHYWKIKETWTEEKCPTTNLIEEIAYKGQAVRTDIKNMSECKTSFEACLMTNIRDKIAFCNLHRELEVLERAKKCDLRMLQTSRQRLQAKFLLLEAHSTRSGSEATNVRMYETHNPGFCYRRNGKCRSVNLSPRKCESHTSKARTRAPTDTESATTSTTDLRSGKTVSTQPDLESSESPASSPPAGKVQQRSPATPPDRVFSGDRAITSCRLHTSQSPMGVPQRVISLIKELETNTMSHESQDRIQDCQGQLRASQHQLLLHQYNQRSPERHGHLFCSRILQHWTHMKLQRFKYPDLPLEIQRTLLHHDNIVYLALTKGWITVIDTGGSPHTGPNSLSGQRSRERTSRKQSILVTSWTRPRWRATPLIRIMSSIRQLALLAQCPYSPPNDAWRHHNGPWLSLTGAESPILVSYGSLYNSTTPCTDWWMLL
uniref:Uncharacterized protein n=1 Tax=Timema poppense TaxID=170557 RepID=A0A7R9H0V3_TIMPO|nr:unnamed protein product [Timema poppensis]